MNILAVGANPDDIEFLCAGTLALYSKRGHNISTCYLTTGDKGGHELPPEEIASIRREEAKNAAGLINAAVYPLDIPDGEVEVCLELRRKLVGIIRRVQPDVIITHYDKDCMSDHNCTSILVSDATFWSMVANFKSMPAKKDKDTKHPVIYNMDTLAGIGFQRQIDCYLKTAVCG